MPKFRVEIDDEAYAALTELAQRERRAPQAQASVILEKAAADFTRAREFGAHMKQHVDQLNEPMHTEMRDGEYVNVTGAAN